MGYTTRARVYILLCRDGSDCTGYTHDLKTRLRQHWTGKGSQYTQIKKPKQIVYLESFYSRTDAMKREKAIKGLTRDATAVLIQSRAKKS